MTKDSARAAQLVCSRWRELLDEATYIGRRPATMNGRTSLLETAELVWRHLHAGGKTRPGAPPSIAGHGVKMLPQVADEALSIVASDLVLRKHFGPLRELCMQHLRLLSKSEPQVKHATAAVLDGINASLESKWLEKAYLTLCALVREQPDKLLDIESLVTTVISDLRARGWTDASLSEYVEELDATDAEAVLGKVGPLFQQQKSEHTCYVPAEVRGLQETQVPADFEVTSSRPMVCSGPTPTDGTYVRVKVCTYDRRHAAHLAHQRVASVLGAASVFIQSGVSVKNGPVLIDGNPSISIGMDERLYQEPRGATPGQLNRIMQSSVAGWRGMASAGVDPLFDAIRHHQRAAATSDLESRFLLLWLALERLVSGSIDHTGALDAAKSLVPPVMALGKLRREVDALAKSITALPLSDTARENLLDVAGHTLGTGVRIVGHTQLLKRLLGSEEESRELTACFYAHPLQIQWYFGIRNRMRKGSGADTARAIGTYIDNSRRRIELQVMRLYRARNGIAHAAHRPALLRDLILHAQDYVTNLLAICVHYREAAPQRPVIEILMERAAIYDAWQQALATGDPEVVAPNPLLRPRSTYSV